MRSLRVALLHLAPELGAVEANRVLVESATRLAAGLGADWVVSGELVVCGYRFAPLIGTAWIEEQPDAWMRRLAELSAEVGVISFVSHPERETAHGRLFNSLFVIGRDGQPLGRQRKLHPTPVSEGWASDGELGNPVLVDGIPVGLLVCADAYAAEPARRLRDAGVQLFVSSAAWWPGQWGPNGEWEARTLDTGRPLIVCNRTGRDGDSDLTDAESVIVDRGIKLLTLRSADSTVFLVDCLIRDGHVAACEVLASAALEAGAATASVG
jgi:predicted amidohydrolase